MQTLPDDPEALGKLVAAQARWRVIFLVLAIGLPFAVRIPFDRQTHRLEALASNGVVTDATVTAIEHTDKRVYTRYEYIAGGMAYTWTVARADANYPVGERLAVLYLPAHPELSRPTTDRTRVRAEAAEGRSFVLKVMIGIFAFFALNGALSAYKLRQLRKRQPGGDAILISPVWIGRVIALGLFGLLLMRANGDDPLFHKAFGARLLGMPLSVGVPVVLGVLYLPFFWFWHHLFVIVAQAVRDGASSSRGRVITYIARAHQLHPELVRSRRVVLGCVAYFVVLVVAWIAFTSARGI